MLVRVWKLGRGRDLVAAEKKGKEEKKKKERKTKWNAAAATMYAVALIDTVV